MTIVNTMFEKGWEKQWTHENAGDRRQLDYCVIGCGQTKWVLDAEATDTICLGLDNRS